MSMLLTSLLMYRFLRNVLQCSTECALQRKSLANQLKHSTCGSGPSIQYNFSIFSKTSVPGAEDSQFQSKVFSLRVYTIYIFCLFVCFFLICTLGILGVQSLKDLSRFKSRHCFPGTSISLYTLPSLQLLEH